MFGKGYPAPVVHLGAALVVLACQGESPAPGAAAPPHRVTSSAAVSVPRPARPEPVPIHAAASPSGAPSAAAAHAAACPEGMNRIPGGSFQVGSPRSHGADEETPRFKTHVDVFCVDRTEVTVTAYARCVAAGACEPAHHERRSCNARRPDRADHPINCVDWNQASKYCTWRSARLPTEVEWEYVARGGDEYRPFPWGRESPDGRTCWKHVGGSCQVAEFPAGAFGLHDIVGNVWEWTDSPFGAYPWPPMHAETRVYRGGSWSRRFEKWLSPTLRNRSRPSEWGSHLGFRCALTPEEVACHFGRGPDGRCRFGVLDVECSGAETWNGARCARRGEPVCPAARHRDESHGCVLDVDAAGVLPQAAAAAASRSRSPEFDSDCAAHYPGRPHAFRYAGGSHHDRNRISRAAGCANRDVGVGWNSTCCP